MKYMMLRQLQVVIVLFFLPKFLLFSYEGVNPENEFASAMLLTSIEFLDMVNFIFLLCIFYPRKEWPRYFSLGLENQFAANVNRN